MATIQLRRRTSTTSTGPYTGTSGRIYKGEPQVDLNGGSLYISKVDKSGSTSAPIATTDYYEYPNLNTVNNRISSSLKAAIADLNLGTASTYDVGTTSGTIPVLDSTGKLSSGVIPSIAITDTFVCASQTEMLALSTAQTGDVCVRTDVSKTYILKATPSSTLSNWVELETPDVGVTSVNGKTGAITINCSTLGAVTTSTYNNHVNSNVHLTQEQIDILNGVRNTNIVSNYNSGDPVLMVETADEVKAMSVTDGLVVAYEYNEDYAPHIQNVTFGLNVTKVLTPTSVIDGGTF